MKFIGDSDDLPEGRARAPRVLDRIGYWVLTFVVLIVSLALVTLAVVVIWTAIQDQNKKIDRLRDDFFDALDALEIKLCAKIQVVADDLSALENRTDAIEEILADGPFQPLDEKAQPDGYCPLDGDAIVPDEHLPPELVDAMFLGNMGGGCWDSMTNDPLLKSNQLCEVGEFYVVNNTGTTILDSFGGIMDPWQLGDAIVCTGDIGWKRIRDIPRVKTWNGLDGDVMAFLGSLIDVDTTGAVNSDVLHFDGSIWEPLSDCCIAGAGDRPGFFATFFGLVTGGFVGQIINDDVWTPVNFRLQDRFKEVEYVIDDEDFDTPNGVGNLYEVPHDGWWEVHSKVRFDAATQSDFIGMRLFRVGPFPPAVIVREAQSTLAPLFPQGQGVDVGESGDLAFGGVFPFCKGDLLQIQVFETEDDDDEFPDDDDQVEVDLSQSFLPFIPNNVSATPSGEMFWSMWKVPDPLMPPIISDDGRCRFVGRRNTPYTKEEIERFHEEVWPDPGLVYEVALRTWNLRMARKHRCDHPLNCTAIDPGPCPEPPPKPPPPTDPDQKTPERAQGLLMRNPHKIALRKQKEEEDSRAKASEPAVK